jgi:hypothetical protein
VAQVALEDVPAELAQRLILAVAGDLLGCVVKVADLPAGIDQENALWKTIQHITVIETHEFQEGR